MNKVIEVNWPGLAVVWSLAWWVVMVWIGFMEVSLLGKIGLVVGINGGVLGVGVVGVGRGVGGGG